MRFGTMFSGGEGVGVGLTAAGLHHVWGIEYDADIAAVAARVIGNMVPPLLMQRTAEGLTA